MLQALRLVLVLPLVFAWPALAADHAKKPAGENTPIVALMDNLGDLEHPITTGKPLAQQYFNQGMRLIYAFNHDEAIRAFEACATVDPQCPMAHWGIALANGPNYNLEAEKERSARAYRAMLEAKKRIAAASPREAAYIEALSKRYAESPEAPRKPLDAAYANAMRKLAARYPDDLDAAVLFAESMMNLRPWDLWTIDGQQQPGTGEIVATLEAVLHKNPRHPGANHYYIHTVEASLEPQRGLPCALRLGSLVPGAGHLVHMPSHIFFRLGRWSDAVDANKRAVEVDREYIKKYQVNSFYSMMYYPHNIHFLYAALCMEGRGGEAIPAATEVVKALGDDVVKQMPMLESFLPTRLYALARFHKWDEILNEKPPLTELTFSTGMWHYAQGLACAAGGRTSEAADHQRRLAKIIAETPEDQLLMRHSALRLLRIAAADLGAKLDAASGNSEAALAKLQDAVLLQDGLLYDEPPPWYYPMRQALGAQLLAADRPLDAETVYSEDLRRNPENGWSLHGLERALRALKRTEEADRVHERFVKAWARADFKLDD